MNPEMSHVRKPWIATSLSLICTGLGQIYCGRVGRGLLMYTTSLMFGPLLVVTALAANFTPMLALFLVCMAALLGLVAWSVRDAGQLARRMESTGYQPQEFNRVSVYAMMASTSVPYVIGLAFFLRATMIEAFVIPTASMAPTLIPGDRILVTKMGMTTRTLERGQVVVFRNPVNRRQTFVKRIVGLPGETVEIKNGTVMIDGRALERIETEQLKSEAGTGRRYLERAGDRQYELLFDKPAAEMQSAPQTVGPDAYYVLGDHRDVSVDSREVGAVPHGLMVGIVQYLYLPGGTWNRFGAVR